jgi:hypothetical protein
MNTIQFLSAVLDWLLADPAHIVVAASIVAALTPTPDPGSIGGKFYKVVDLLALNILRAKEGGAVRPAPSASAEGSAPPSRQAGFARGLFPVLMLVAGAGLAALLSGCAGTQTAFATINAGAVQAQTAKGEDEILIARELLCGAPYQVVANAMAADSGMAAAVPGLCPATRTVAAAPAAAH